ncbi:MAG: N-acetylglucosamine-6-phosphate deacetylase [Bacteroidota bacterium]|nr:N-acetylglucosamine-6-phosphate deacetylase [Bacteroidota bacterium]
MKKTMFVTVLVLLIIPGLLCAQREKVKTLTGISYEDGSSISVSIEEGIIANIEILKDSKPSSQIYIAPGLIDLQINGYMGVDFGNPDITIKEIRTATQALWKEGITTFLPTVITNSHEALMKCFMALASTLDDPEIGPSIPGFHLEGPYVSPVQGFRGAHLEKYIRPANLSEFKEYQKLAKGGIKLLTLAPETEGSISLIEHCKENNVIVSLGHHNGSSEEIKEAIDAGASLSTHLGNGCANMINRHYNPLWPQLADDRLTISIISDGFHLTKEELQTFYKVKGDQRTILVSDALDLAGLTPGEYIRGERKVLLTPNVVKFPEENVLAGAASSLRQCVGNIIRFTHCSLKSAITMASSTPAKLMGFNNIGEIGEGKRADLILFTIENGEIIIQKTIVAGRVVYAKE